MSSILRIRSLFDCDDVAYSTKKYLFDFLNRYTVSSYRYGELVIQPLISDVLISDNANVVCFSAESELQVKVYTGGILRLSINSDLFQLKTDSNFTITVSNNSPNPIRLRFVTAEVI